MTPDVADDGPVRVAIVRESLEDRELTNYLSGTTELTDLQLVTGGTGAGQYSHTGLGLPVTRLHQFGGSRVQERAACALRRWLESADSGALIGFRKALTRLGPDVVNVNELHNTTSAQAGRWRAAGGPPVVVCCFENIPFTYEYDEAARTKKRVVAANADRFVAATPAAVDALLEEGIPGDKVTQLTFGVDVGTYTPGNRSVGVRRTWGADDRTFVALFAGRLIRGKGLSVLLRALRRIGETDVRVVIIGEGPEAVLLQDVAQRLGVSRRVTFAPWVGGQELRQALASADVCVLPSLAAPYWEEQLGFAAIEAMSSGVPVITTCTGSLPWVVGPGGVLVPPNDPDALATELAGLAASPETVRAARVRAARSHVERQHNAASIACEYAALHVEVARTADGVATAFRRP